MAFFILSVAAIFTVVKWGDWRNWRKYYPTIAFWIIGNYLYDTLTYTKPLWLYYAPQLNHTLNDMFWKFIIYPCIAMVFLYRYPKSGMMRQLSYCTFWIVAFSIMEWLLYACGYFLYYNGWDIWWSVAFNCMMFPVLKLHHYYPPLAWAAAAVVGTVVIVTFKIPIMSLR